MATPSPHSRTAVIPDADRKGRLGVHYVQTLLAQAGVIHCEISSGEDHLAVDMMDMFDLGSARVQVKCGSARAQNQDGSFSLDVYDRWREIWAITREPVYLVYVHLQHDPPARWIAHPARSTSVHAVAYWERVNRCATNTVRVSPQNRLTIDTFDQWRREAGAGWTSGGQQP